MINARYKFLAVVNRITRRYIFKPKFGSIVEGLAMEDVCICYGHLVYFTVI
jgi:hypothetical protein